MTITLRNKRFNTKDMGLNKLSRLNKLLKWELKKLKNIISPKYNVIEFVLIILKRKIKRKENKKKTI
jgi:hypothetical protein